MAWIGGNLKMSKNLHGPQYRYKIRLQTPIHGVCIESTESGKKAKVAIKNFVTGYDGEKFFLPLEDFTHLFLNQWQKKTHLSLTHIENCVIVINKERIATVSVNCPVTSEILSKEDVEKGSLVFKDSVGDIRKIFIHGVKIPPDCGLIHLFSLNWRRGLYFDFSPLLYPDHQRNEDLSSLFASLYAYLFYPEIFRSPPDIQRQLFELGWFPFIRILGRDYEALFKKAINKIPFENIENQILGRFDAIQINKMYDSWMQKRIFVPHKNLIRKGIDEYLEGDPISAIHILYPRIEGVIQLFDIDTKSLKLGREEIIQAVKSKNQDRTLFLPEQFNEFLKTNYLNPFDKKSQDIALSRHSLAHGVVTNPNHFSKIRALQAILTLDQLSFYVD